MKSLWSLTAVICILLTACQTSSDLPNQTIQEGEPPTSTLAPTDTRIPSDTPTPSPTPLPGNQVIPIESMADEIPWLPLDAEAIPMTIFIGINNEAPPLNVAEVRQAFAAATDRQLIADLATRLKFQNVEPATQFTPPRILGRSMYGEIGIGYNPDLARELMAEAGYTDMSSFPKLTMVVPFRGIAAPGFYAQAATALAEMWSEHLGVSIEIIDYGTVGSMVERIRENPPHFYLLGWGADVNDPDNFLNLLLHTGAALNLGHFSNSTFDELIDQATSGLAAEERQMLYIEAEKILTQDEAGVIPLVHTNFYTP